MKTTLRVLVTDDEEGMRLGCQRALSRYTTAFTDIEAEVDFEVDLAGSGEEALERIAAAVPDVLLLDYKLPGIDGLEVLGQIRERGLSTVTIMITAYASLHTAVTATKQGAFDFLSKPFTPEELRAAVRKAAHHVVLQRRAREAAEEKRRVRFEFISVLAHELKAPLGAIEGYLDLIREGAAGDPESLQHVLDRSLARVRGMRKLILDLLDMTRIEAGTKPREIVPVDLESVARGALELVGCDADARGIRCGLDCPAPVVLEADRSELEVVLNNLVSNAVKYNRDGGEVDVSIRRQDGGVRIAVRDTGIGLTPDEAGRLFKDFVRIKNARTRTIEGSGLGLSTVSKIATLYGGRVMVESLPDVGSTFTVILPLDAAGGAQSKGD